MTAANLRPGEHPGRLGQAVRASERQIGGDHYRSMAVQPSEFIFANRLNWLEGNAIKYICRHAQKHGAADIDKAIHYLELLKEWVYPEEAQA